MYSLLFNAPTINGIIVHMDNYVDRFENLLSKGFVSTADADRFITLEHEINCLTYNVKSQDNRREDLFTVEVSEDLSQAIQDIRNKINELETYLKSRKTNKNILYNTSDYVQHLQNLRTIDKLVKEKNELLAKVNLARRNIVSSSSSSVSSS